MPTESHRLEVVAEAKHGRKAVVWEVCGLLLVLAVGSAALAVVVRTILANSAALRVEEERLAAAAKPEPEPVDVQVVTSGTVRDAITLPGVVFPNVNVKTPLEVAGRVVEKLVENGHRVKRGDVLLRIDPRDYAIRARRAESALNLARLHYGRIRRLSEQKAVPLSELDAAEDALERAEADVDDARLALERCEVASPIDGDVAVIRPEIGEWLKAGDIVADIVDIDTVKIAVGIAERDLHAVRNLDACEVTADSVPGGHRFVGRKSNLSLAPSDGTQVYELELTADNAGRLLRPGMFVEADVVRDLRDKSMMVGAFAVMTTPSATYEVAVVADVAEERSGGGDAPPTRRTGVARRVPVTLGVMRDSRVEILLADAGQPGLHPGDLLIVNGQRTLDDGTPVRIRREVGDIAEISR